MKDEKVSTEESNTDKSEPAASPSHHPSRSLEPRSKGYGIGGGYEKPYRRPLRQQEKPGESYGPVPHSGYYGAGAGAERFERGQAGFRNELSWYSAQYGEKTSGEPKQKS